MLIEKLFRSKKILQKIHLVQLIKSFKFNERNPGTNLGELMFQLKITKQSLNRVLRDLIESKMIKQIKDEEDTRKKNLFLDKEGKFFLIKYMKLKKKEYLML